MHEAAPAPQIIILCSDILFLSKITGVADQLKFSFSTAISCKKAAENLTDEARQLILIDLNLPNLDWELLASIHRPDSKLVSIAFGPHVDTERIEKAKIAGCTQVLPRSQFSVQLPKLLQAVLATEP
jgi:DNA-binding NtrC family response regulator